jgi:hypothetical protein
MKPINTRNAQRCFIPGVFFVFLFHFSGTICLHAQSDSTERDRYIHSFTDQPQFTFEFARRRAVLQLVNPTNSAQIVKYEPNTRVNFVSSFDYRWISLSLGLFSFQDASGKQKGTSDQFFLRFSFNGKKLWNTNFIQNYQGMYLANPAVADSSWTTLKPWPQRPDISSFTLFSNLAYCFNGDKFSYRGALWQLDQQKQSAGSFIAGVSYRLSLIDSDTSMTMIPLGLYGDFQAANRAVSVRQSTFTFHAGYIHTFVSPYKPWFLTIYFLPGLAIESGFYRPDDLLIRNFRSRAAAATEFRLILGYNADKWFSGISIHRLSFTGTQKTDLWVNTNFGWIRLFGGFRLNRVDRTKGPKLLRMLRL